MSGHTLDESRLKEVFEGLHKADNFRRLTDWEKRFVLDTFKWWNGGVHELSDAQMQKLEQIWCKIP